jgi:hypothetical protein
MNGRTSVASAVRLAFRSLRVARDHRLETDAAASVHYAPGASLDLRPEYPGLTLASDFDRSGVLVARVVLRDRSFAELNRSVTASVATHLDAEFGSDNVVMHEVHPAPIAAF